MKRSLVLAHVCCLSLMLGCSLAPDDHTKGGEGSGVDEKLQLAALDVDQAQRICHWAGEQFAEVDIMFGDKACTVAGINYSETPEQCRALEAQCLSDQQSGAGFGEPPPRNDEQADAQCADHLMEDVADCEVTVEELQNCMADSIAAALDFVEGLSCDAVGQELQEPGEPETCKLLATKCPDAFGAGRN